VVQVEQDLETSDRGFPVCALELLVDGGGQQKNAHGIRQFAAQSLLVYPTSYRS